MFQTAHWSNSLIIPEIKAVVKEKKVFRSGNREQKELQGEIIKKKKHLQEEDGEPAATEPHQWSFRPQTKPPGC